MQVTVYRLETSEGRGPYIDGPSQLIQTELRHDLDKTHPVAGPTRIWLERHENFRYGFTSWVEVCAWWGHWEEKGIELLQNLGFILKTYIVPEKDICHLNQQCVFDVTNAIPGDNIPLTDLLDPWLHEA